MRRSACVPDSINSDWLRPAPGNTYSQTAQVKYGYNADGLKKGGYCATYREKTEELSKRRGADDPSNYSKWESLLGERYSRQEQEEAAELLLADEKGNRRYRPGDRLWAGGYTDVSSTEEARLAEKDDLHIAAVGKGDKWTDLCEDNIVCGGSRRRRPVSRRFVIVDSNIVDCRAADDSDSSN